MVKVLVVHNRRHLVSSLRRSLQRHGVIVFTCLDGDSGSERALEVRPDLLVVGDSVTLDGGELLADSLRARPELSAMRMITITQRVPANAPQAVQLASGVATLELPFRPSAICALLRPDG